MLIESVLKAAFPIVIAELPPQESSKKWLKRRQGKW